MRCKLLVVVLLRTHWTCRLSSSSFLLRFFSLMSESCTDRAVGIRLVGLDFYLLLVLPDDYIGKVR